MGNQSNLSVFSSQVRAPQGSEPKIRMYDADHERKRKIQLEKLFNRTTEEVINVTSRPLWQ